MSRLAALLTAALTLAACSGQPRPPSDALLKVGGPLEGARGSTDLRPGILWYAALDPGHPSAPRAADSGPRMADAARWQLELSHAPPAAALGPLTTPGGGSGWVAAGELVLFRDRDGDGRLTLAADGSSPDELVGSSAGALPFDLDTAGPRTLVLYRSGTLGTDEPGLSPGYTLVTLDEPFARPRALPASTEVPLRATHDPRLQLSLCPAAFAEQSPEFACGQRVFRTPRVTAVLLALEEGVLVTVHADSGERSITDARVLLNGVPVPADGEGGYALLERTPRVARRGANRVRVEAPGLEPVTLEVVLPSVPSLVWPLPGSELPAGAPTTIAWNAVEGATSYDVSLTAAEGQGGFEATTGTSVAVHTPAEPGPAVLRLSALFQGSAPRHVTLGTTDAVVPVRLVPTP